MHQTIEPSILYMGTPVVLLSTLNTDGTPNLAPISSAFWLGWRGLLGIGARSQTAENLLRTGECVLNLPSDDLVGAVDRLALTTGRNPVPEYKERRGYRHEADKFGAAGLTPMRSEIVAPPRAEECPVQMEAILERVNPVAEDDPSQKGGILCLEVRIVRVHAHSSILMNGKPNHIDPDKWRPLIMSFQRFYGLGPELHDSRLATIPEASYRSPDVDRARLATLAGAR
ncbi:MAG: flavin reductase family protein [Armatimonadetes bacterium]|nr:flavin reductase family protein [Armatimonadota bacterium]